MAQEAHQNKIHSNILTAYNLVLRSRSRLELPRLGWSRSRFLYWPELTFKAAPAAHFWQAKKESLVLVSNMT